MQVARAIADGATTLSDIAVLRHQPALFGAVASTPTVWRTWEALTAEPLARVAAARAAPRRRVWAAGLDPQFSVLDIAGTLVTAHSGKDGAAPLQARLWLVPAGGDTRCHGRTAGGAAAAGQCGIRDGGRPHRGSGRRARPTAGGPPRPGGHRPDGQRRLFAQVPGVLRPHRCPVHRGPALTEDLVAAVIGRRLPWIPAVTADGTAERDVGQVAEVTPYVDPSGWPPDSRLLVRREVPHPGAPLTFTDLHGYRYQLCLISLPDPDIAFLEALYRGRGRCGQVIRDLKATGLAHLPSADFAAN